jgi:hypothetical protein
MRKSSFTESQIVDILKQGEAGDRTNCTIRTLTRLAKALNVPVVELLK